MIKLAAVCTIFMAAIVAARGVDSARQPARPNIVLIYADDLGYGDVSAYGATTIATPSVDRLAREGVRFTDAHSTAATCTPSRYSLLTGEYAWRRPGTGILPGDARLIIDPARTTLPSMLQKAGYRTGVVGKWHLGLGPEGGPNWNGTIAPGPNQIGFNSSFIMAATGDRVPTVYVEDGRVVGLDPADPIAVSYAQPVGDWPTGAQRPDLLTMRPTHGHDQTIVNGISRIGYMTGGRAALWKDEDMGDVFAREAVEFIDRQPNAPFFLFFALHEPHVPRVPHPRFVGTSGMGARGDAILQLDWAVGEVLRALDRHGLTDNTLVIFTSDNGPVLDDGYDDAAVERLGRHRPGGPYRGGKYSTFEAGTRVPFIVRWPARVRPSVSHALMSQVDLLASLARLTGQAIGDDVAPDSLDTLSALLGGTTEGRTDLIEQGGGIAIRQGPWKYIEPNQRQAVSPQTKIELGNSAAPQLYDLASDPGETANLADRHADRTKQMQALLDRQRAAGRTR
jgi:arylsulfatase A-like enzyme